MVLCSSPRIIIGGTYVNMFIAGDVNFDHLVKIVFFCFSTVKLFSFVIDKYLVGRDIGTI